ncbi:MAG TPA: 1,2-phenylacetyl-CoA epoxidase subunit PaaD [Cryptosporangiaceae bacterium]|nr:1,2-phenylacetyl-CoA epoxidase subunit PaaD [Cryptosporangiaceae bacterium]
MTATADHVAELRERVAAVLDPELPVVTIEDLGILRDVSEVDGRVVVSITPTYSGCPATEAIAADVRRVLAESGHPDAEVRFVLAPAWTTDWITDAGREALAAAGIAPPGPRPSGPVPLTVAVRCPCCGSPDTRESSRFGSTPCKALRVCNACQEPFDHVKPI